MENLHVNFAFTPIKKPEEVLVPQLNQSAMDNSNLSPFKRVLFWPKEKETNKKLKSKDKIPAVVTSELWQEHYKKKEEQKVQKEKDLESRKRARQEKKEEKK